MRFKRILLCFLLFTFHFSLVRAQVHYDHLAPLKSNPALVNYTNQAKKSHHFIWRLLSDSLVLNLPFLDDFSHGGPYPDTALWLDNAAFINNTYPICPPTLGVATLDGANSDGRPYNPSCPPGASYPADSLTSRPINMAQYLPHGTSGGDSVYFSFYWQAGGRSYTPPLPSDTLLLQFRTSGTPWTTVWYQLGYTPVPTDTGFHRVMIMLNDTMHGPFNPYPMHGFNPYDANFQFRFKNYACTSANADQWNIDEVYINKNRNYHDTVFDDVSFVYESPRILANYEYMPWEQFTANDLADTLYLTERNNTGAPQQIIDTFKIHSGALTYFARANINTFPGYNTNKVLTHIPIKSNYTFTPLAGPTNMPVNHYFSYAGDFIPWNDTLSFTQTFGDFYAYDDGSAEASYFINGTTPLDLAEEITVNKQDTLRGLELYFDYMFVNPANYNMILAVWDNTGPDGSPGNLIFENNDTDVANPRTSDSLNGFTYYPYISSAPVVINAGQTIYVGWIQTNGDSLNIGFDLNTNSQSKICYNANAFPAYWSTGWNPGDYPGSLMMRPVFGGANAHSPVLSESTLNTPPSLGFLNLYPNPAKDMVNLSASMAPNTSLRIYTADGREYLNNSNFYGNSINTSALPAGFYIVEVTPSGGQTSYQKLLIQR